jgi:hypothetical protein
MLFYFIQGCGGGSVSTISPPTAPPPVAENIQITTPNTVQCVQNVPFSLTLAAQGNSSAVTWTVVSGQLPSGFALDAATGIISGTTSATYGPTIEIQATDGKAQARAQLYFIVWAKLTIPLVNAQSAHLSAPYNLTITGQSSTVISWQIVAGQLPPGLSLNSGQFQNNFANLTGTPTQLGTYTFTIQAQDLTIPQTATSNVTIVVDNHLAITKSTLKVGGQNQVFLDSFAAVNGIPPLRWSISGNIPAGLSLNSTSGQLIGTPTDFGGFPYTVSVSDSAAPTASDSAQGILQLAQQLQVTGQFNAIYIGQPYFSSLGIIGGTYPYTWTISSGTLPAGLTLTANGTLTGTPTQIGSKNVSISVTDSGTPPYAITVSETLNVVPTLLSVLGDPLSPAPVNSVYHSQIPISGGTPPYSFRLTSGQLPPGLTLDSGTGFIDGTPTQIGTFNFVAGGSDSGNPVQTAPANDFIEIRSTRARNDSIATATPFGNSASVSPPLVLSISPYIDPISASTANPDTDFYKIIANGGSSVHVETFAQRAWGANTLDSVLEILDSSGLRYTSCTLPSYSASCLNDDLDSTTLDSGLDFKVPGPPTSQTTFYVHVFDWRGDARPDMQYYLNISGVVDPLTISPNSLGVGATRGASYQQQFTSQGGTGSVVWSVDTGALPAGWSLNTGTGLLSGIATTDGTYTFTIKATDSANPPQSARVQFTILIGEPVVITSPAVWPNACVNQPYTFTMTESGGVPPIRFLGVTSNRWVGINVDPATGIYTGSSSVTGTFTGTAGAYDSAQPPSSAGQTINLTVVNCP